MRKAPQNFLLGALNLSAATAVVKIIGALYKVPIQNLLGEAGSSLYNVAYNIYALLFVLATAGLPVAISKMVSESVTAGRDDAERIFSVAFTLFFILGSAGALFTFFAAGRLAALMNAEDAAWAIRAVSPSVLLIVFIAPYRGYYQGYGDMKPTAVSQVIEAAGKMIFGTGLTFLVLKVIIPADGRVETAEARSAYGSAAAILGVGAGVALSAVYFIRRSRKLYLTRERAPSGIRRRSRRQLLREMAALSVPITLGSAVLAVTNLIDSGLTRGLLVSGAGFSEARRDIYHGAYSWALTLFNMPPAFVMTIAVSLLPAIAACRVRRDNDGIVRNAHTALRVTALLGMPAGTGLAVLARPILNLLYGANPGGVEIAAPLLRILGIAVVFVCVVTVTNAILQSLGMVSTPIVTMAVGAAAKLACTYIFVSRPAFHINGAPAGTLVCYALISALNLLAVMRVTGAGAALLGEMVKPLLASAGMGFIACGCYYSFEYLFGAKAGVILAIITGILAYLLILALIRGLPKRDLELLPGGAKLARFLKIR